MAHGHAVERAAASQVAKKRQPCGSGGLLEVVAGLATERLHIGFAQLERKIESRGQIADKNSILERLFPAELVIQMQHCQAQVPARRELTQNVQQTYGIGPSGDCHSHPLARLKHAITGDSSDESLEHF